MLQFAEDLLAAPPPAPAALASAAWVSEGRALGKRREIMALLDALREETELAGRRARRPPPGPAQDGAAAIQGDDGETMWLEFSRNSPEFFPPVAFLPEVCSVQLSPYLLRQELFCGPSFLLARSPLCNAVHRWGTTGFGSKLSAGRD